MAKQALTSDGVAAKTAELYALSTTDLQAQANLITNDFRTWIGNNFTLTTAEATYLASMETGFLKHSGTITGTAVNHRLPISIVIPTTPPSTFSSKYTALKDKLNPKFDSLGGYTVTGSVEFDVVYT
jgi:hypothetical protein